MLQADALEAVADRVYFSGEEMIFAVVARLFDVEFRVNKGPAAQRALDFG